jgi:hypothetical protein
VLEVRQNQFLVLLLVMKAQFDDRGERRRQRHIVSEQSEHLLVHVRAVAVNLADRRPGQETAARPGKAVADGVVVRVKKKAEMRVERRVIVAGGGKDERLEEPGGMSQVPFDRAGVGHRLHNVVLGRQRLAQTFGLLADQGVRIREPRGADAERGFLFQRHHGASQAKGEPFYY